MTGSGPAGRPRCTDDDAAAIDLLTRGRLAVRGRLTDASNGTYLVHVEADGTTASAVYKPVSGERPLWDFPDGTLAAREVAAYAVSAATGWALVPPTVLRDGPFGPGMCQLWVGPGAGDDTPERRQPGSGRTTADTGRRAAGASPESGPPRASPDGPLVDVVPAGEVPAGWLPIVEGEDGRGAPVVLAHADHPGLRRIAVLDTVLNNADRKGGHVLRGRRGRVYGIDHGVTFHVEDKLRTVLWGWAGSDLLPAELAGLSELDEHLAGPLARDLAPLLTGAEVAATRARVRLLLRRRRLPRPDYTRRVLPWPPM